MRIDFAANDISSQQLDYNMPSKHGEIDACMFELSADISLPNSTTSEYNKDCSDTDNSTVISDSSHMYDINIAHTSSAMSESINENSINESDDIRSLNFEENWMGLTSTNAKKFGSVKRNAYLDKCPEWDSVDSKDIVFIPTIKNGSLCKPIKVQNKTVMLRNTCAFDALLHITAHIIGIHVNYKCIIETIDDDSFLRLAEKVATRGKISRNEHIERALFLINTSLFQNSEHTRRFNTLDAMCNAAHLAEHTFVNLPSLRRTKICKTCNFLNDRKYIFISINVNILLQKGLQNIQEAIDDTTVVQHSCIKCNNLCDIQENYGPQIMINTTIFTDSNYIKNNNFQLKTNRLDDIAKNITIDGKKYLLRGVVNYIDNMRHYTAIIYNNISWYEYDDLKAKRIQI